MEILNLEDIAKEKGVSYKVGIVKFKGYEKVKKEALALAERIKLTEVTEENIQLVKKELAKVNKGINEIEDVRKLIKKELLIPYTVFEEQVKEIVGIVKEADLLVRNQVRELEEMEREQKRQLIENMFNDKIKHYEFAALVPFTAFLKPNMINKSTSINSVEIELSTWLNERANDIDVINTMEHRDELMVEYLKAFNLANAISTVNVRYKEREKINEVAHTEMKVDKKYIYIIEDEIQAKLVEMLMKENKINYKKEVR